MGSGTRIKYAITKYGIENFSKEILKFFDNREDLANYEAEIVNEELVHDLKSYNISCGGEFFNTLGTVSVIDENGNKFRCKDNDPNYLSGKYKGITTGLVPVIDKLTNKKLAITKDEYYNNKERYETFKYSIYVKYKDDINDNFFLISQEELKNNKDKYITLNSLYVNAKDKNGNIYRVRKDDPRYLSGELKFMWCGKTFPKESAKKLSEKFKSINFHKGETNPMYGTCWIYNLDKRKSLRINKNELDKYLNDGWIKGRKMFK